MPKCLALLRGQPIAEAHSQLLHTFNAANTFGGFDVLLKVLDLARPGPNCPYSFFEPLDRKRGRSVQMPVPTLSWP
jgi:hypothetical protein